MPAMVTVENLTKRFPSVTAVDGVSFRVERGEVLGFLGPNGAGKSTTMRMIAGFLPPDAGAVRIGGDDLAERPIAAKRRLGYLPEGAPLYGDMTPRAFLGFVAEIRGHRGADKRRRLAELVAAVHLEAVLDRPIETLSKGFKRRVGLAQAILHDPDVLVLDEPTDGLDPNQKHEVRGLIRALGREKAIILSTHILEEVDAVCTRALIIAGGRVVADGTPDELAARSRLHNAVTVGVRAEAGRAREALAALPGVGSVEVLGASDGLARFHVYPGDGRPSLALVSETARRHGWEIEELYVERGRLDEVFRAITRFDASGRAEEAADA